MSDPKPGELWLGRRSNGSEFIGIRDDEGDWYDLSANWLGAYITPIRRLIVLDPESADDVQRMLAAMSDFDELPHEADARSVLRNLAAPPEPEIPEPTAVGTVVVDGRGKKWVHADPGTDEPWFLVSGPAGPETWEPWQDIPRPVRLATDEERGA